METRHDPEKRRYWKFYLIRRLYERGYARQDVLNLLHFLDWIMRLPADLEQQFQYDIHQLEEELAMPYISSFERKATEKGLQQGLQQGHQSVFANVITHFGTPLWRITAVAHRTITCVIGSTIGRVG